MIVKTKRLLLYIGGVVMVLGAILHVTFWWQYHWGETLNVLTAENRGVVLAIWIGTIYMSLFFCRYIFLHRA
jgi:hypothetical protein